MFKTQKEVDEYSRKLYSKFLADKEEGGFCLDDCFEIIELNCHADWSYAWKEFVDIYKQFSNSYLVLSNFAFAYLEQLVRSITSEYPIQEKFDSSTNVTNRKIGRNLIELAKKENAQKNELLKVLEEIEHYFRKSCFYDGVDNRNSIMHGYSNAQFFDKKAFENLLRDIAWFSIFSRM